VKTDALPRAGRRWATRLLALPLGAAVSLAFPEANAWGLAYVGLVPVLLLVSAAAGPREAAWRSWLAGSGFFAGLHHWLVPSLGPFAAPAMLVAAVAWIPWGVVVWMLLRRPLTGRRAAGAMIVLPAAWVLTEYARSWDRLGGSWGYLGYTQWRVEPVLAVAALGGVWALSFLLVAANTALAVALSTSAPVRARVAAPLAAVALVGAGVAYGLLRPEPLVEGHLRLAGVQPGVVRGPQVRLAANEELTREAAELEPDLIVWGQSSVGFDPEHEPWVRERLVAAAAAAGTDVLVNVDARRPNGRISKSAVLITAAGPAASYDKMRLVPFGEYIPLRPVFGWVADFTEAAAEDRVPGGKPTLMTSAGVNFGPVISYESTFPDLRRQLARMDAELTIVQAAATTFQGSWAQPQQASFEAVRAVESGRPAVLVAVSGTSAGFDARGRLLGWVPADQVRAFLIEVPLSQEQTLFVRAGDWVPGLSLVAVAVVAGAWLAGMWRRHRALPARR
jgi:apolipoprotein N-acyltransferase